MEQIIPILIAAVVFGFQAYSNYRKEQEKAKQRQQSKPAGAEERGSDEVIYDDGAFPEMYNPAEPEHVPVPAEYFPAKPAPAARPRVSTKPAPNPYGQFQGTISPEEARQLVRQSSIRTSHRSTTTLLDKKLAVTSLEDEHGSADTSLKGIDQEDFDLRQAVIHSIILERPYA